MRIVDKYTPCEGQNVRIISRTDTDIYITFTGICSITKEIDCGTRYVVLHHETGEKYKFHLGLWKVAISAFVPLW